MLVAGLVVVSLVGRWMGAVAVGEYLLVRRVATWISSGAQLGLGVALPRYVAKAVGQKTSDQLGYLAGALLILLGVAGTAGALLLLGRALFAQWFFGSPQASDLIWPLIWLLLGLSAHAGVYGFYRGRLAMHWANALQIINIALVPVVSVALLYRSRPIAFIVSVNGATMPAVCFLLLLPLSREFASAELPRLLPLARELLRYGSARVPGEFAGSALFALGPVIAAHYVPLSEVSRLLLGLGLLMAVSVSVAPIGTVLLSKITMMIARNKLEEVRLRLEKFLAGIIELSVFVCLQLVVFADVLIRVWVGKEYLTGIAVIQITLLSIPFYLFFVALRSAIDAVSVVAYNAHNGYVALAVFLAGSGLAVEFAPRSLLLHSIAGALMAANAVLAWRTSSVAAKLLNLHIPWRECALPTLSAVVLGMVTYWLHRNLGPQPGVVSVVLIEVGMCVAFLGLSRLLGSNWLSYFYKLLITTR